MNVKGLLAHAGIVFVLVLVISVLVSFLWSLIALGVGTPDWEFSFRLAVILGLVLPVATGGHFDRKKKS